MIKNVWHVGGWSINNFGDRILQKSTTRIIKDTFGDDLSFTYVDNQRTYFSEQLISKINKEADLIFVGGGGFLFRPAIENHSGWQLNIDTENIKKIQVPIIAYGFGFNKFPYDTKNFSEYTLNNIQTFIDACELFSVRNSGTLQALKSNGLNTDKIEIVPDAGMFVEADLFNHKCFDNNNIKIGLNWATDRQSLRFGSDEIAEDCMHNTLIEVKDLADKYDAIVYIVEHLCENDINYEVKNRLRHLSKKILGNRCCVLYNDLREELYPPFDYSAGFFANIYSKMDLVIGMRGHSAIVSFGKNTPFIGIGQHNKIGWFLEEVGLEKYLVKLGCGEEHKIFELTEDIFKDKASIKNKMKKTYIEMVNTKNVFMNKVYNMF